MIRATIAFAALALLAACGPASGPSHRAAEKLNTFDVAEAPAAQPRGPQIAYSYSLAYTLDAAALASVQAKQLDLCRALANRCQVVKTSLNRGGEHEGAHGQTDLIVDARIAVAFQQRLDAVVTGSGGSISDRGTEAEDVTKQVIDTEARVRAKQALADRLLTLIKTSPGKVGELVQAEQAYAQTQEELDAARSLQETLRRRVAMSAIAIRYDTKEASDALAPVRRAVAGLGESLAWSIAGLVTFVVVATPWVLVLAGVLWGLRRLGWRWRFWRRRNDLPPV